jgi:uroporphyrinogen-III synthase
MRVLVTRPRAAAERTAARLAERGYTPIVAPVLSIARTGEPAPTGPFDAIIATSANAVAALAALDEQARGRPVFAVGERTALAARDAGLPDVRVGRNDGAALATMIEGALPRETRLLHIAGRDRKTEPQASLREAGYEVVVWTAYAAVPVERLPDEACLALKQGAIDAALHYSRRSATILLQLARHAEVLEPFLDLRHACLSEDVAEPLRDAGARRVTAAKAPNEEALIDACGPAAQETRPRP